ncbi:MAG: IS630 family transposase [Actinomycetota bacterium]|nr:IS630 family transposase [Actinomycetota bacterium]
MPIKTAPPLVVSADQRAVLERMARSTSLPEREVIQARGLVLASQGVPTLRVAKRLGVSPDRVRRWRARFEAQGLEGVGRIAPGRGRKPWLPAGTVAEIVRVTREERPADGSTHWSTRTLARRIGVNRETVRRVWRDHGLKPWRVETFKLSNDPDFERKLVDVVGLYLDPPERAVVFSFDEKTQVQALDRTQPSLPLKRGRAQTMTHDYKRHGTTDLFAALNITSGEVISDFRDAHTGADVLAFFKQIDRSVPRELEIHVVLDNLSAHKAPEVREWLAKPRQRRWHLHFTPTSSSWLNLVEGWFRELTQKRLRRGSFCSLEHLTDAITLWAEHWNDNPRPFIWRAEANAIIAKTRRGRHALNHNTNSTSDH